MRTKSLLLHSPAPLLAFLQQLLLHSALGCMISHVYTSLTPVREEGSRIGPGGFPGGPVVKNPPANAGDTGSSSARKIPHAHAPQLLSLHSRAREPQLLRPRAASTEACAL